MIIQFKSAPELGRLRVVSDLELELHEQFDVCKSCAIFTTGLDGLLCGSEDERISRPILSKCNAFRVHFKKAGQNDN